MKRRVTFDGRSWTVRSDQVEIPDLQAMSRMDALFWLNQHTYATGNGIRTTPNPLQGIGSAIKVSSK